MKVSVIGGGSWGTALAMVLADNQHDVSIHVRNEKIVNEINNEHTNSHYLKGIVLPPRVQASTSYSDVLYNSELILVVVPSHALRDTIRNMRPFINKESRIIHATKGIENDSLKTMSQIIEEELSDLICSPISVLSGPSHAEEVARKTPTTVVIGNQNKKVASFMQQAFMTPYFRVYTNTDIIGIEVGGALKNIIALGAGISDGLGYGDNGKAALLTRGLTEITRLGIALGGNLQTFSGLTGMGDLIVTGTSKHSRNWRTGYLLSQGIPLKEALNQLGMVAEGVKTTKSVYQLSKKLNIDTPITNAIYHILFENKDATTAAKELMNRMFKDEQG